MCRRNRRLARPDPCAHRAWPCSHSTRSRGKNPKCVRGSPALRRRCRGGGAGRAPGCVRGQARRRRGPAQGTSAAPNGRRRRQHTHTHGGAVDSQFRSIDRWALTFQSNTLKGRTRYPTVCVQYLFGGSGQQGFRRDTRCGHSRAKHTQVGAWQGCGSAQGSLY